MSTTAALEPLTASDKVQLTAAVHAGTMARVKSRDFLVVVKSEPLTGVKVAPVQVGVRVTTPALSKALASTVMVRLCTQAEVEYQVVTDRVILPLTTKLWAGIAVGHCGRLVSWVKVREQVAEAMVEGAVTVTVMDGLVAQAPQDAGQTAPVPSSQAKRREVVLKVMSPQPLATVIVAQWNIGSAFTVWTVTVNELPATMDAGMPETVKDAVLRTATLYQWLEIPWVTKPLLGLNRRLTSSLGVMAGSTVALKTLLVPSSIATEGVPTSWTQGSEPAQLDCMTWTLPIGTAPLSGSVLPTSVRLMA